MSRGSEGQRHGAGGREVLGSSPLCLPAKPCGAFPTWRLLRATGLKATDMRMESVSRILMRQEMFGAKTGFLRLGRAATWLGLEDIVLSEESQTEKDKHCLILPVGGL